MRTYSPDEGIRSVHMNASHAYRAVGRRKGALSVLRRAAGVIAHQNGSDVAEDMLARVELLHEGSGPAT